MTPAPACHPERYRARGLCASCYAHWHYLARRRRRPGASLLAALREIAALRELTALRHERIAL
jgi:hypothetical protein